MKRRKFKERKMNKGRTERRRERETQSEEVTEIQGVWKGGKEETKVWFRDDTSLVML